MQTIKEVAKTLRDLDEQFVSNRNNVFAQMAAVVETHIVELERLNVMLTVPAAEYVPAIQDAFTVLDAMLAERERDASER